jgi:hypothetical protein
MKVNNWIIGKWRLVWKLCPNCNSDAPKLYDCEVCNYDTQSFHRWNKTIKNLWWNKYVKLKKK